MSVESRPNFLSKIKDQLIEAPIHQKFYYSAVALNIASQIADITTTQIAFNAGAREGSMLAGALLERYGLGAMYFGTTAIDLGLLGLYEKLRRAKMDPFSEKRRTYCYGGALLTIGAVSFSAAFQNINNLIIAH